MRIANYLRPDCVALRQRADSLTGAVQQMVTLLVHSRRRAVLAIAQALLAQVAIAPQDARAQSRPSLVRVNAGRHAGYHLRDARRSAQNKKRPSD